MITREAIAGAIRGAGFTNGEVSDLTRIREQEGIGAFVNPDAISSFLRRGEQGADLGFSRVQSIVRILEEEGVKFASNGWLFIPEGLLAKRRGKEKIREKGKVSGNQE